MLIDSFIVHKPWGQEEIFIVTPYYVGKIITINSGHRLSLQYHKEKMETIRVLTGCLTLESGETENSLTTLILHPGESFHITPKIIHRMSAQHLPDGNGCTLLEISTPQLNDVVRLEDDYGRV